MNRFPQMDLLRVGTTRAPGEGACQALCNVSRTCWKFQKYLLPLEQYGVTTILEMKLR
jgi:hypothetical protein